MENNTKKVIENAKKIALSVKEKNILKNKLYLHIKSGVIPSPFDMQGRARSVKSTFSLFGLKHFSVIVSLLLVFIVSGTGTSIVADSALPGDVLYPVKVGLNENVESLFAVTPEAKAQIGLKRATRRLVEAETLKTKGELTVKQSDELQKSFLVEVDSMNNNLAKIKEKGNHQAAADINTSFEKEIDSHLQTAIEISGVATTTSVEDIVGGLSVKFGMSDGEKKLSTTTKSRINVLMRLKARTEAHKEVINNDNENSGNKDKSGGIPKVLDTTLEATSSSITLGDASSTDRVLSEVSEIKAGDIIGQWKQ